LCVAGKRELIGVSRGAKAEQKFGDTKGVMAVLRVHGERISQAYYVYPTTDARSHSHCCRDKSKYKMFLNSMCVLTLTVRHGKHMIRNILWVSVGCIIFFHDYKINK
jgi:hypothetical protein